MYAIIEIENEQFKVSKGDIIYPNRLNRKKKEMAIDKVLLYSDGKTVAVGNPYLKNVTVNCNVLDGVKGPKLIAYKYKRRKNYARKVGHRQSLTKIEVVDIIHTASNE